MNLATFCTILREHSAAGLTGPQPGLPPNELRFVLEYAAVPAPADEERRLSDLFPQAAFHLQPLSDHVAASRFLILRFPAFERVFRHAELFNLGYQICDAIGLVSVEPDLGADVFSEPATRAVPSHESAFVRSTCQVGGDPPETGWALGLVGAAAAWTVSTGVGIRIGHADTGYTEHPELKGTVDAGAAVDVIDPPTHGIDPLRPGSANPGHGTRTASVIASRRAGRIAGVAPDAVLVPIRCIDDVKVFNQSPVAAAILYAQGNVCDVISMSLGGVPSRALYAAVTSAIGNNIIVLAAAGNCITTVVWPARYDEVIAVAGCNVHKQPWIGSSRGTAVDITAPAEQVWCASIGATGADADAIEAGQGTSYAVAMVAGAAALWLSAHSRDVIIAEASRRGTSVQSLFKGALQATARRPPQWDVDQYGAGILDVFALVQLPLAEIPLLLTRETALDTARSVRRMLADEHGTLPVTPHFSWERYGCELAAIALQTAKEGGALTHLRREGKTPLTFPSQQLADAIDSARAPALLRFGTTGGTGITIVRPSARQARPVAPARLRQALSMPKNGVVETSAARFDPGAAQAYLKTGGIDEQLARVERTLQGLVLPAGTLGHTMSAAQEALASVAGNAPLSLTGEFGIEALIALTGRPAMRTVDGKVNLSDPRIGEWYARLYQPVSNWNLNEKICSVGRIDLNGRHVGTGFVIAPGRILTNRHVLQDLATPIPTRDTPTRWVFNGAATIDFSDDPDRGQGRLRFEIMSVVAAGKHHIDDVLNCAYLDAAILEVKTVNSTGSSLPPPLKLWSPQDTPVRFATILTIGYPAELMNLPSFAGRIDDAGLARLDELYDKYKVRYIAPGEVTVSQDHVEGSPNFWTMQHDATTLNGCSGSVLLQMDQETGAVGLHFGGTWRTNNFAHAIGTVNAYDELFHAVKDVTWIT